MLESLHIRNYVSINSLDISFPEGLVVITGATGAGKSILVGALGLLLGRKADPSVIGEGAESCVVEGEFFSDNESLRAFAEDNDFEYEDGHFTVRRTVARSGRSRAFVNDTPVTVSVLEEFGAFMVDIHSQHDTRLLTSKSYQLSVLDAFAGNAAELEKCRGYYDERRALASSVAELKTRIEAAEAESEYNRSEYEHLDAAGLVEDEMEALEAEQLRLSNAEELKELLSLSAELLDGSGQTEGVNADLARISRNFARVSRYIKSFDGFSERLESVRIELDDLSKEVGDACEAVTADPERLQRVDERISLLTGLMKRHKVSDIAALMARRDALKELVFGTEALEEELAGLERQYSEACALYDSSCDALRSKRKAAAGAFCRQIKENLAFMELERADFDIEFTETAPSPCGKDEICFMFNAAGGKTVPLAKCASGGELSRIMLALKQLMGDFMSMPVIVFDEIDTGVSGSVADRMGSVICSMGARMQVFAITHLPQVAAKGQAHYIVEKTLSGNTAESIIKKLSAEQRVLEIARMLSGSALSPAAIENARALLS